MFAFRSGESVCRGGRWWIRTSIDDHPGQGQGDRRL